MVGLVSHRVQAIAGAGALNWLGKKGITGLFQIAFGAGAEQVAVVKPVEGGERVWGGLAKGPPGSQRVDGGRLGKEFLAEVDLITVAAKDVLPQGGDGGEIFVAGEAGDEVGGCCGGGCRRCERGG